MAMNYYYVICYNYTNWKNTGSGYKGIHAKGFKEAHKFLEEDVHTKLGSGYEFVITSVYRELL